MNPNPIFPNYNTLEHLKHINKEQSTHSSDNPKIGWRDLLFSEAVLVNPPTQLNRGTVYPFVDMSVVQAGNRNVRALEQRKFNGGGSRFQGGDTLMARITPSLEHGKIAYYCAPKTAPCAHGSTEFIVIRGRPNVTDNDYAYYLTKWDKVCNYAISQMTGTSGRQRVPADSLDHLVIPIPPLHEQRSISYVLNALDAKIELNQLMNQTLEEMSRALFKSWFVDFDPVRAKMDGRWRYGESLSGLPAEYYNLFPDRLMNMELGKMPERWEVKALGELINIVGGSTPDTKKAEYWQGGVHCWATPKDLSTLLVPVLLDTKRKITNAGLDKISSGLLPPGTLLLSARAPIGYLAISEEPTAVNQGFIAMPPSKTVSNLFMLYWCKVFHNKIINYANGSTFLEINKKSFRLIKAIIPDQKVMTKFDNHIRPFYERMVSNEKESRILAAHRDALLPKLVSGEFCVEPKKVRRVNK